MNYTKLGITSSLRNTLIDFVMLGNQYSIPTNEYVDQMDVHQTSS